MNKTYQFTKYEANWDSSAYQTISLLDDLVRTLFPKSKNDINIGIGLL